MSREHCRSARKESISINDNGGMSGTLEEAVVCGRQTV